MLGEAISHYRVLEKLGQGGMGEVYLAEDTRLGRRVALKFLAPHLLHDHEAVIRFEREAKAAAELSHPNIATIYDFDEADGKPFLALEYLRGESLRARIARGPLSIEDFMHIAKALSAGLAEAHSRGIIHRDIKSSNIMLTEKNEVKILDFGLAHRIDATQITHAGTALGTVAYMSPEQSRGEVADGRSDLWSAGIVFYECLTGTLPFTGDGASIVEQIRGSATTPPTGLRTGIPMDLERIVLRCLEKDPRLRYQHADDLQADLLATELHGSSGLSQVMPERGPTRSALVSRAVTFALVVVVVLLAWLRPWGDGPNVENSRPLVQALSPPKISPLLSTSSQEGQPAWSPTGNLLAYEAQTNGDWDIWLCDLDGSNPLNLTNSPSSHDEYPEWSPDGQNIAFYSTRDGPGIYTMTITGGKVRRLRPVSHQLPDNALFFVQWLDDDRMLYGDVDATGRPDVYEYELDSQETRCLTTFDPDGAHEGELSANGSLLCYRRPFLGADVDIVVHDLRSQKSHVMPLAGRLARWLPDGQSLLILSTAEGTWDLWWQRVDVDSGEAVGKPNRLTTAFSINDLALSPDGNRAVAVDWNFTSNVWSLPTDIGPLRELEQGRQLTNDAFEHSWTSWLPGSDEFLDISDRRGIRNVWRVTAGGREQTRLREENIINAIASPDGQWIVGTVIESAASGFPYVFRKDGSGFRELYPSLRERFPFVDVTSWSLRGNRLAMHTRIDGEWRFGTMSIDPQTAEVNSIDLLPTPGGIPFISPQGTHLVYQNTVDEQPDLFVADLSGENVYRLTDDMITEWVSGWEAEPSRIYYKDGETGAMYRVLMDDGGLPLAPPELWIPGNLDWHARQWLDFQAGRAIGPVTRGNSDLWLVEFEPPPSR